MKLKSNSIVVAVLILVCSFNVHAMNRISLLGFGNYFELLRLTPAEIPTMWMVAAGGKTLEKPIFLSAQTYQGGLQIIDLMLPVTIKVRFNMYNGGRPYTILIKRVTDPDRMLACQGVSMATVEASIEENPLHSQKVCVPLSSTHIVSSQVPIYAGDFNNVVLLVGPLGVHDVYDPQDVRSLPFRFGLMVWTSLISPWNNKRIYHTYDQTPEVSFVSTQTRADINGGLEVIQGIPAWGNGPIPRNHHASVIHVFNDTSDIALISRQSQVAAESYNITKTIPEKSVIPYALVWIPRVNNKEELTVPGHDGLRITLLKKAETARAPTSITHSEIKELAPINTAGIPQGFADLQKEIDQSLRLAVTNRAAELLGVTGWNQEMQSSYQQFGAGNYYTVLATNKETQQVHIQIWTVSDNVLVHDELVTNSDGKPFIACSTTGIPHFFNIVISNDALYGFKVRAYPAVLKAPRARVKRK